MRVSISAVGFATAQGGRADVLGGGSMRPPLMWPWPSASPDNVWTTSKICRPAHGVDPTLTGRARWRALLKMAVADCFPDKMPPADTPIFLASCNGSADGFDASSWSESFDSVALLEETPWEATNIPVFSSSCNSGLHALYAATQALNAGASEAVVIAADILSRANQNNFEGLRVLAESATTPWQENATGFILGEAAVALRIERAVSDDSGTRLSGPVLRNDLNDNDGLRRVLAEICNTPPVLILGQGTGPRARDESELTALRGAVDPHVPISTPLFHFGHTLGASGLLSIAIASLAAQHGQTIAALGIPGDFTVDGRPLARGSERLADSDCILVTCGALDGSCAGATIGKHETDRRKGSLAKSWQQQTATSPLMHPTLRKLTTDALSHRPAEPPDLLIVTMDQPLAPPAEAWFGERLLPSAVLEMTPGVVPQLLARTWGFVGPALCQIGNGQTAETRWDLLSTCRRQNLAVAHVYITGTGDNRDIIWNA